jgi:lipopolysaccharide export LptBFGC system permease protein LptF
MTITRRLPLVASLLCAAIVLGAAGYAFVYFPIMAGASTLVRGSSLPPFIFAWAPFLVLAIVATTLLRRWVPQPA